MIPDPTSSSAAVESDPSGSGAAKVVWITGAGGGLGSALVEVFEREGWRIAASVRTIPNPLPPERSQVSYFQTDVQDAESVENTLSQIESQVGEVDVLIHAAGVTSDALLLQMSEEDWDRVVDTSLKGAFLCSKAVIRGMMRRRRGHILLVSSFSAKRGHAGQANYAAAKAGLVGFAQSLAAEVGSRNIQVNAIFPGVMQTRMLESLTESQRQALLEANVLKRLNDPNEVARFLHVMATFTNISGQVFQLDSRLSRWT